MDNNSQYLQMFFDESAEYLQILNENILEFENNPDDKDIINAVFRAAHSLKGMSATMGFNKLTDLTHKVENILDRVRKNEIIISEEMIDLLFAGIDYIKTLVDDIRENGEETTDISDYTKELNAFLAETENKTQEITENNTTRDSFPLSLTEKEKDDLAQNSKESETIYKLTVILRDDCMLKNVRGYMILKRAQEIGLLIKSNPSQNEIEEKDFDLHIYLILLSSLEPENIKEEFLNIIDVEEVITDEIVFEKKLHQLSEKKSSSKQKKNSLSNLEVSPTVRVDINKLDNLMNMVGELLINKTRLEGLKIKSEIYQDIIQQLDRVTMELHHIVMQIRMVPIGGIFNRFPRMVRDLAKELDKEVDLIIEGADTELDRSIIDELADPLIHILRNAVDHGLEKPAVRKKHGKDETGTILLKAYQKGSEIIIEVEDDGSGIDVDKLINKVVDMNLATAEEVEDMDEKEKMLFIFHPGLSTSQEVTDVSGRGVGMDVVKRIVESLDGQIFIETEKGVGTRFTISLPLTLAITQALMVQINQEIFAIPLSAISETLLINPEDIRQVRGQDVIVLRDSTIPIVEGARQLNLDIEYGTYINNDEIPVVILNSGDRQIGLIVDDLLNQQEIVIKSLGNYLVNIQNISGATIVGDGDVALILDVRNIA